MEAGSKLGHFEILEPLGAGGMGEVYLARDTRLGRTVAIKVLPTEFASDPERLARFELEARAAAGLNHPHIAAVFDMGVEGDTHFMVQEHLEGETLREPLNSAALALNKALDLAVEIAEALTAAHAAGIVHRDLKPENVFVTREGHAKVLDFGLAKLTEVATVGSPGDATRSPTMMGTAAGQVMGTAGYMAPEQVEGAEVDHRADLFAFGCLLYEMTSGRQPFAGKNIIDTLHRIANVEPRPLAELVDDAPTDLQRILRKCLAKEPDKRYQATADLVVDLRQLREDVVAGVAVRGSDEGADPAARSGLPWSVAAPALATVAAIAAALGWYFAGAPEAPAEATRLDITLPVEAPARSLAVSADGRQIVFSAGGTLWRRGLGEHEAVPIAGTEGGRLPFFSPDGQQLGFFYDGDLHRVPISGGAAVAITTIGTVIPSGPGVWTADGEIYFADGGIQRVDAGGGDATTIARASDHGATGLLAPRPLPGGSWVVFTARMSGRRGDSRIVAQSLADATDRRELVRDVRLGRFVDSGHLVYFDYRDVLVAVPFDAAAIELTGPAAALPERVRYPELAVSPSGTLAYVPNDAGATDLRSLVWVDEDGTEISIGVPGEAYGWFALSPDATRIAYTRFDRDGSDIWTLDVGSGDVNRLTYSEFDFIPAWSPDGSQIVFASGRAGAQDRDLYTVPTDGSSRAVPLSSTPEALYPTMWAPDGRVLMQALDRGQREYQIRLLDLSTGETTSIETVERRVRNPTFSPDGRWLVYRGAVGGDSRIYIRRADDAGGRWSVSPAGSSFPRWAPDSRSITYEFDGALWRASLELGNEVRVAERRRLFDFAYWSRSDGTHAYDVHPETGRFLFLKNSDPEPAVDGVAPGPRISVVLNWFEELKRLAPAGR